MKALKNSSLSVVIFLIVSSLFMTAFCYKATNDARDRTDVDPKDLTDFYEGETYLPGQGILSIRVDDGHSSDFDYVYPELEARGLVAGFAIIEDYIGQLNQMTISEILELQEAGHEIMCHSKSHGSDPASTSEFYEETVGAAQRMRMTGLNIVNFVFPGSWITPFPDGYLIDSTDFYGSNEDLLLRANFKAYEAYIDSLYDANGWGYFLLPRRSQWGVRKVTVDTLSGAFCEEVIDTITANGWGYEFLWHSNRIGKDGYMSKTEFEEVLDYIEGAVEQGNLVVMTPTQQLYAQPEEPETLNYSYLPLFILQH